MLALMVLYNPHLRILFYLGKCIAKLLIKECICHNGWKGSRCDEYDIPVSVFEW